MESRESEQANNETASCEPEVLEENVKRQAYLITYSRADTEAFDREGFANAVATSFKRETNCSVKQWCCCLESHKDGAPHFHMAILLDKAGRWS